MKISKVRSHLYRWARILGDIDAVIALFRGNHKKFFRRIKNKVLGRLLGKMRIWR